MISKWERLTEAPMNDYRIFRTQRVQLCSPRTQEQHDMFVVDSADWVNVIPLTGDEKVICIRQYRVGLDEVTLEIPGGLVDAGESPLMAAQRELTEETGYVAGEMISLGRIAPNPAIQNNYCHSFLAKECRFTGETAFDEHEDIEVELVPLGEISRYLGNGRINHALVSVAFHKLALLRAGELTAITHNE